MNWTELTSRMSGKPPKEEISSIKKPKEVVPVEPTCIHCKYCKPPTEPCYLFYCEYMGCHYSSTNTKIYHQFKQKTQKEVDTVIRKDDVVTVDTEVNLGQIVSKLVQKKIQHDFEQKTAQETAFLELSDLVWQLVDAQLSYHEMTNEWLATSFTIHKSNRSQTHLTAWLAKPNLYGASQYSFRCVNETDRKRILQIKYLELKDFGRWNRTKYKHEWIYRNGRIFCTVERLRAIIGILRKEIKFLKLLSERQ